MKKEIIANWKMNLSVQESVALAKDVARDSHVLSARKSEAILCPSYPALPAVQKVLADTSLTMGAQDIFWEQKGSYTGEVSGEMLRDVGCSYVIIGHSERRNMLGETGEMVQKKLRAAIEARLIPILCVGERFEERQNGLKDHVITEQVRSALKGIDLRSVSKLLIAYEPVWVIGSGQAVEPQEAEYTSEVIQQITVDIYQDVASKSKVTVLYGGSVDEHNVVSFVEQSSVGGVLIGGASLSSDSFSAIIQAVEQHV